MMKVLQTAIEKLRSLPEDKQAYAAEILEHIAAADDSVYAIPSDHEAAINEGLAQARRGEFVSDDTVHRVLRKAWD